MTFEDFVKDYDLAMAHFYKIQRKNPNAICCVKIHSSCGEYIFSKGDELSTSQVTIERSCVTIEHLLNEKIQSMDTIAMDSIGAVSYIFIDEDISKKFISDAKAFLKEAESK